MGKDRHLPTGQSVSPGTGQCLAHTSTGSGKDLGEGKAKSLLLQTKGRQLGSLKEQYQLN
jgi:hypothetical protein